MAAKLPNLRLSSRWGFLLGVLCIALVLFSGTIQAVHTHPDGSLSHADCSLCVAAHVVADVVSNPIPVPAALTIVSAPVFETRPRPARLSSFALFTRPPPVLLTLA